MQYDTYDSAALKRFRIIALIALIAVFILIWVGSSVRATGSGLGCPDWPTCFGQWIPPLDESELPDNYQQIYADRGYAETRFNPIKTWIEYVNRLFGVSVGFLIVLTALFSIPIKRSHPRLFYVSWLVFVAVSLQGWLGARVISSGLSPGVITVHMLMALFIMALLIVLQIDSRSFKKYNTEFNLKKWVWIVLGLTVIQVLLGIQVREIIDFVSHSQNLTRSNWIDALPWFFYVHRSFSIVVLLTNVWFVWKLVQNFGMKNLLTIIALGGLCGVVVSIVTGALLNHLGFPMLVQPLHLLMATFIFATQFSFLLIIRKISE